MAHSTFCAHRAHLLRSIVCKWLCMPVCFYVAACLILKQCGAELSQRGTHAVRVSFSFPSPTTRPWFFSSNFEAIYTLQ